MGARFDTVRAAFSQSCLPINYVNSSMHLLTTGTCVLDCCAQTELPWAIYFYSWQDSV